MEIIGINKENYTAVKGFFPEDIDKNINEPGYTVYAVIEDDSALQAEVLGVMSFVTERPEADDELKIDWIFVAPDKRGNGVGSYLVRELIDTAKKAGISLISAALPDEDTGLERFFTGNGFEVEDQFLPFFEGTVGELKACLKDKVKSGNIMKDLTAQEQDELMDLYEKTSFVDDPDEVIRVDLSDENKAAAFDEIFTDCSMTVVRTAVYSLAEDIDRQSISVDEALMLISDDAPFLMPRFNALENRVSGIWDDYQTGADSQDGPYILLPADGADFDVKLYISLSAEDEESFMVTASAEFDVDEAELEETEKKIEVWEDEALFVTAGIDTAYRKVAFVAGIPCEGPLPASEDLKDFIESFEQEVKSFFPLI